MTLYCEWIYNAEYYFYGDLIVSREANGEYRTFRRQRSGS